MAGHKNYTKIAILLYSDNSGNYMMPMFCEDWMDGEDLPVITNDLLAYLGLNQPDVENDDVGVEWFGPYITKELPKYGGSVKNWRPK